MARTMVEAGAHVTVYARWHRGLRPVEVRDGYRLVRVPFDWRIAVPGLRGRAVRRAAAAMAATAAAPDPSAAAAPDPAGPSAAAASGGTVTSSPGAARRSRPGLARRVAGRLRRIGRTVARPILGPLGRWHWWRRVREFPLGPSGWARALGSTAEPADIWHGMWAGSLPALDRLRARHGGVSIYDSRDIFMQSRQFARLGAPGRWWLEWLERRWAGRVDRVLTVNEAYAGILASRLHVTRPAVVMNCPATWTPPSPPPDLIRAALGLDPATAVVLYQGIFTMERGIEQAMDAVVDRPDVALVLLGFGPMLEDLRVRTARPPYAGRVHLLPAVPPDDLLRWTASADALVMAIQPTTLNHRFTTPQKLFEGLAAGVPVIASDLPGMAEIVRSTGAGVLCDPTSPASIRAAIDTIVDAPPAERAALRGRALEAAHEQYNWEAQARTLVTVYRSVVDAPGGGRRARGSDGDSASHARDAGSGR